MNDKTAAPRRILTGITTSGIPHLGNYVGAIRPAIQSAIQGASTGESDAYFSWRICTHLSNATTLRRFMPRPRQLLQRGLRVVSTLSAWCFTASRILSKFQS